MSTGQAPTRVGAWRERCHPAEMVWLATIAATLAAPATA